MAKLARIEIGDDEAESLSGEFNAILSYVGEVKRVQTTDNLQPTTTDFALKNVMREDVEPHEAGIYIEALLNQAPAREGNYIRVKKIL